MKFAVLGDDPLLVPLARAAAGRAHQLIWHDMRGGLVEELLGRPMAPASGWEALLDPNVVDFVLVGRGRDGEQQADQLRKLIGAARPLLLVHPISLSVLLGYELDMIRRESRGRVHYYWPGRHHPLLHEVASLVRRSDNGSPHPLGQVEQVTCQRWLADRSRDAVLNWLARDADLIAALCGPQTSVGTLKAANPEAALPNLSVQMSGPSGIGARWSVAAPETSEGCRVTVLGNRAKAVLHMPADQQGWRLELPDAPGTSPHQTVKFDDVGHSIDLFTAQIHSGETASDWFSACQAVEVADAAVRSMAKGRTIELFYEEYSDAATFKGRMAAFGCALLLLLPAAMCLSGVAANALRIPKEAARWWPLVPLAPVVVYLLIQAVAKLWAGKR